MSPAFSLLSAAARRVQRLITTKDADLRLLVLLGVVLLASGLAHVVVWAADGFESLLGPTTWRKPITFGITGGITTLSVAWLTSLLPASPARRWRSRLFTVAMALEVLLIDVQQWRGVPSHFNMSNPLDYTLYIISGVLILTTTGAIAALVGPLLRAPELERSTRRAALLGIALMLTSAAIGIGIAVHASVVIRTGGGTPGLVGEAGLLKISHGIGLHGLQTVPFLAWGLAHFGVPDAARARAIGWAAGAHWLFVGAAFWQALEGRTGVDLSVGVAALAIVSALALVTAVVIPLAFQRAASAPDEEPELVRSS